MPGTTWRGNVGTSTATNSTILGVEHSKRIEKMTAADGKSETHRRGTTMAVKRATARKAVKRRAPAKKAAKRTIRKTVKRTVRKTVKRAPARKAAKRAPARKATKRRTTKKAAAPAKKTAAKATRRQTTVTAFSKLTPTQQRQIRLDLKVPLGRISDAAVAEWRKR
jgi:hypothetical protein